MQGALTQDPDTGFVMFFAVFDHQWILQHAHQPFSTFFNREMLHDLSTASGFLAFKSNSDGVRIAFVLNPGETGRGAWETSGKPPGDSKRRFVGPA